MQNSAIKDFGWFSPAPANGESGARLAAHFVQLVEAIPDIERICDLGCGNGYMSGLLANLGYEVVGVDASVSGLEIGRRSYPNATFVQATINDDLAEKAELGSFDLVVSSDVIEHLYAPSILIEKARSLLNDQGHLLIGTPYHGYWKNLALSLSGKMDSHYNVLEEGGHIKFFSVKTLSTLIRDAGFAQLDFSFYGRAPRLWKNMICHGRKV